MNKKIILLVGKKGSGKTTNANMIKDSLDKKVEIFSFAKGLKEDTNVLIKNSLGEEFLKPEHKEFVRPLYQVLGNLGRKISDRFWLDKVLNQILKSDCEVAIIDDVRFVNEFAIVDGVPGVGLMKIKLTRESEIPGTDTDISETSMDGVKDSEYDLVVWDVSKSIKVIEKFVNK